MSVTIAGVLLVKRQSGVDRDVDRQADQNPPHRACAIDEHPAERDAAHHGPDHRQAQSRRSGTADVTHTAVYHARIHLPGRTVTLDEPVTKTSAPRALPIGEIQSVVTDVG